MAWNKAADPRVAQSRTMRRKPVMSTALLAALIVAASLTTLFVAVI